jgi:hypothetical protein
MKEEMFYIVNNVDFVYTHVYVCNKNWYKIVLYICAIDTVLIIVSYNSVKNGSLIYCCTIVLCIMICNWEMRLR